ncbi:protein-serine/threonine phosphatase [Chondrocystis sp. NIES-4102]|nr:protein-serine/threonine phosphatase [Chondrocystis sp. NIES-4102]
MPYPEPRIQCSNPKCAASNTLFASICGECKTPIVRHYLWSNKKVVSALQQQQLINQRYLVLGSQIFLDTKPHQPPITPEEVPPEIVPYLQLFSCYPHVPQIYGLLDGTDAWLLDYGTVPSRITGELDYPQQLIPRLQDLWSSATAFKQLNWLWQIAHLWTPLASKAVVSTLLNPDLLRINGQVVQILQLQADEDQQPSFKDLGNLWLEWSKQAHSSIRDLLKHLATHLQQGSISQASQIITVLDQALNKCSQLKQHSYQIYALSDAGPNRNNNEDAAYPIANGSDTVVALSNSLAIVCDGVGGHDGGEIASQETIKYLQSKISRLSIEHPNSNAEEIFSKLTEYINGSNDIISQRNDSEQRQERRRMGTTLVMALASLHQVYLAHIGDSRIYWITANSCHQVTIDDDLASREVRLGYAVYRDSLQYPSAGALIQALGMRDSTALHPNLQRYMIEDDCIFLLCTDGLSDFDRVEQQWRHKVLPVLEGKQDLASAVKELISVGNEKNGHDNVTVALVYCQVKPQAGVSDVLVRWSDIKLNLDSSMMSAYYLEDDTEITTKPSTISDLPDTKIPQPVIGETVIVKSKPKWLKPLIALLVISTIIGSFAYYYLQKRVDKKDNNQPARLERRDTEIERN